MKFLPFCLGFAAIAGATSMPRQDKVLVQGHVAIYYDTSGIHAPLWMDDADHSGVPDYIDSLAVFANQFWSEFLDTTSLLPPTFVPGKYPKYPIVVGDMLEIEGDKFSGTNTTETYPNSKIYIENDFLFSNRMDTLKVWQPTWTNDVDKVSMFQHPYSFLKSTVWHELLHGVQRNYATSVQYGALKERVPAWLENDVLYQRGGIGHTGEFSRNLGQDFLRGTDTDVVYGSTRFLTVLEKMAGTGAVLELVSARRRWIDSLGSAKVGNPDAELGYFTANLARHGIDLDGFLARYYDEVARAYCNKGSVLRVEEEYYKYIVGPARHKIAAKNQLDSLGPLATYIYEVDSTVFHSGGSYGATCETGTCWMHAFTSSTGSYSSGTSSPGRGFGFPIPAARYFTLYVSSGPTGAKVRFTDGPVAVEPVRAGPSARVAVSVGRIVVQGLETGSRYRLRAWTLQGRQVLDRTISGVESETVLRPVSEGALGTRLDKLGY